MKHLIVVDTLGRAESIHEEFKARFPFVKEWVGHQPPGYDNPNHHPHGGMALAKMALPLWQQGDEEEIVVHFIQIFDNNGQPIDTAMAVGWIQDKIREIAARYEGKLWVNNSWGAYLANYVPPDWLINEAQSWRNLQADLGERLYVGWAGGNSGDYRPDDDNDYPQSLLTDIQEKVGSADRDGVPSSYSGDSRMAPPIGVYWATDVVLFNPNDAQYDAGSGTSFACPKHVGVMAARGITTREQVAEYRKLGVYPESIPLDVIPHPKWGHGWFEDEYQKDVEGCPYLHDAMNDPALGVTLRSAKRVWFGYRQMARDFRNIRLR